MKSLPDCDAVLQRKKAPLALTNGNCLMKALILSSQNLGEGART